MPDDVPLSPAGQRLARVLGVPRPAGRATARPADAAAGRRGGVPAGPVPRWLGARPGFPPDRATGAHASARPVTGGPGAVTARRSAVPGGALGATPGDAAVDALTGGARAGGLTGGGSEAAAVAGPAPDAGAQELVTGDRGAAGRLGGAVAAFDPGRPGLRVLAVVALVVGLVAAGVAWWSRPDPEPVTPQLAGTAPEAVATSAPAELVVAVSGKVHRPGLVRLPPGARVADAIEAAGGALPEAELDQLNLARKVTDGELIAVGVPPPPDAAGAPGAPGGGPLNLNTATAAQLETLPGIGPTLAQRIIDYRTTHGPFTSVGQLREVPGIGEARFAELEALVTV